MVANPGGVGLLGSVERCFELGGRGVVAVAAEPVVVEPVDPAEGGELELVDAVPAVGVGTVDGLGLVETVGRLGQRVDAPIVKNSGFRRPQRAVSQVGGRDGRPRHSYRSRGPGSV